MTAVTYGRTRSRQVVGSMVDFAFMLPAHLSAGDSLHEASLRLAKRCIDQGIERDPQGALALEIAAIEEQLASGRWMGKP